MQHAPFSLERALRITAPTEPLEAGNAPRKKGMREPRLLPFDHLQIDSTLECKRVVRWDHATDASGRFRQLEAVQSHGASYRVVSGAADVLVTHVFRHSSTGLRWKDSQGECLTLDAGALAVHRSRQDLLVQLSTADEGCTCDFVQLTLRGLAPVDRVVHVSDDDMSYCNSSDACIRVMLGSFREHLAQAGPLPGMTVLDIDLVPFADVCLPVRPRHVGLAVVTSGSVQHQDGLVEAPCAITFAGTEPLARIATQTGASILWVEVVDGSERDSQDGASRFARYGSR